ncbi:coiled-coil domain-containing protein 106-like isoform X2 [Esox lucius]|uniref:Coiled-coil domain-containing protein 106-like n=1 Tax=Esox lucius TaxID=8010 RepID=A0AAY5LDA4_ESOLU|nr:coiled-coil domain-containing protein 106-like isoform X2 [Esox lucius]
MEDVDTESFDSDAASSYTNNENMKMKMLKMKIKALEEERDFLRTTITQLTGQRTSSGPSPSSSVGDNIAKLEDQWDDSSDSSSSDSSSSTDSEIEKKKKNKQKKKKNKNKKGKKETKKGRAKTPEDILRRYKMVLAAYKRKGSMAAAFQTVGVDRNTVAMSAPLAEIMIAAPEFFKKQPAFECGNDTLNQYVRRITKNATAEVSNVIKEKKKQNELLPITYTFK